MSGFYGKVDLKINLDIVGANLENFENTKQIQRRIEELKEKKHIIEHAKCAID